MPFTGYPDHSHPTVPLCLWNTLPLTTTNARVFAVPGMPGLLTICIALGVASRGMALEMAPFGWTIAKDWTAVTAAGRGTNF